MPNLHRRQFLQTAIAAGAAPLFPTPAMVVAPAPASYAQMLWASLFARAGNLKSPAEAARVMNVNSATASSIYNEVKSRGITGLANPAGLRPDPAPLRGRSFRKTEPREKIDMVALMKVVTRNMANETAQFAC